jgi:HlyD family secretion protein
MGERNASPGTPPELLRFSSRQRVDPPLVVEKDGPAQSAPLPSELPIAPKAVKGKPTLRHAPAALLVIVIVSIAALSTWYLIRPEPLLLQGEVDATRLDIAARVDGRVAGIPVVRGQNVSAGTVLVRIDNPETIAKLEQARAAKVVARAQLANIDAGTRPEVVAARKAAHGRAQAAATLA